MHWKPYKISNELENQLLGWAKYLMGFDYKIIYCPGKMNMDTNMLLRSGYITTEKEQVDQDQAK